eukprot:TRINITY_DN38629_c0_g1_i1.p1 TRINITY_DN38629_c0_g1~~TRINITY_DN38629_c0_g1_i1.p1  ORF type:complete len:201 (+),score=38.14 TRINITY_DN38629_c0_g1_i1:171-773(+)
MEPTGQERLQSYFSADGAGFGTVPAATPYANEDLPRREPAGAGDGLAQLEQGCTMGSAGASGIEAGRGAGRTDATSSTARCPAGAEGEGEGNRRFLETFEEEARRLNLSPGQSYWISLRAAWLRATEAEVAELPRSFEDAGPLQLSRAENIGCIRDLSDGEMEDLEDCLDAVQRPFPLLQKSVPLREAVQVAAAVWETDS